AALLVLTKSAQALFFLGRYEKRPACPDLSFKSWCPGEDSVTQARPRLRLQAQPFSSSRKALKRFSSWADMKKGLHAQTFF
ncbi:hypothetical protein, partial [Cupriavidus taiwanensis]|uniref:hypothetical protein n=1 Tax=Cupriavidus taiwanensis TaxID=164546 RepID=UPI001C2D1798